MWAHNYNITRPLWVQAFKLIYAERYVSRTTRSEFEYKSSPNRFKTSGHTMWVFWYAVPVRAHEKRQGPEFI